MKKPLLAALCVAALALPAASVAQWQFDPKAAIAAQKAAMAPLAYMDGTWRGTGWVLLPDGKKLEVTQTERIGPFLDGAVKVIEGRAYLPDGTVHFNALGVISYDTHRKAFAMRSYAMGHMGDFAITLRGDGFTWESPAGPNAKMVYNATVKDGTWHEYGERVVTGQPPVRIVEMTLKRIGDTKWPAADPVPPK